MAVSGLRRGFVGQAAPIVLLILISIVVVLGLSLLYYVTSIAVLQRAEALKAEFLTRMSLTTVTQVESAVYDPATSIETVYISVANVAGDQIRYYIVVLPINDSLVGSFTLHNFTLVDPPGADHGLLAAVDPQVLMVYGGGGLFVPVTLFYPSYGGENVSWVLFGPGYTRPYLLRYDVRWINIGPETLVFIVMVGVGGEYYEIARLYVLPP